MIDDAFDYFEAWLRNVPVCRGKNSPSETSICPQPTISEISKPFFWSQASMSRAGKA